MSYIWNVSICVTALVVLVITKWWYRWSNPKCNGKLPPGSMGFPIIGETIDFFKPHGLLEILPFVKNRMLRYGPLFRTNIFGTNTVVATDPDVIYEIFRQENKSFVFSLPDNFLKIFGKDNMLSEHGDAHKHAKQITLNFLGSEGLKHNMIRDMDRVTREELRSKASRGSFDVKEAVTSLIITHLTPKLISNLGSETQANLIKSFKACNLDWFESFTSLSTWRSFYRAFSGRKAAMKVINDVFISRKESGENHGDFLSTMLEDNLFNEKAIMDHIFVLPVAGKDAISTVVSLALNFIAKNPKVLSELKREHMAILRNRDDEKSGIAWEEYRHSMTFTNMVIRETLRMANVAPVMFRKALNDVEIKGYTIPAGWMVVVASSVIHYDHAIYENPFEFNPWRWEGKEMLNGSKTFMVFGGGVRSCIGAEFARLQIAIFIHNLVTNYDFSMVQDCEVTRTPLPSFPNGVHINISYCPTN
ncbi:Cytochrome P450 superfamily [Arabidopsis thaliana x Arabidopsis arenosa]|uniref:Cytochrome P450 superfamily n=1 Tax=Arabidopsis thaliana x Arabidopsis arenosa TaxID=1240361 RepID=A0A8T1ZIU6_9BRAS|nr:Cytochrome P450 superfamily [Arabidopsis thaliana x Arabidopsis arenosa]